MGFYGQAACQGEIAKTQEYQLFNHLGGASRVGWRQETIEPHLLALFVLYCATSLVVVKPQTCEPLQTCGGYNQAC